MAETIQMSPAVKWFAQAIERYRLEYEIDLSHPDYEITYLADWLKSTLDYNKDSNKKIEDCIELATVLLATAWSEHCKQQEKP
jgi:hypothetical protein